MKTRLDSIFTPDVLNRQFSLPGMRWDASTTAMFLRQLTDIITQTYDIEYPELKARKLFPVDNRFNPGADAFVWRQFDKLGSPAGGAGYIDSYSDDMPNADVKGQEFPGVFRSMGASYQYTIQDMRSAAMSGIPLEEKRADAARYYLETLLEDGVSGNLNLGGGLSAQLAGLKGLSTDVDIPTLASGSQWVTYVGSTAVFNPAITAQDVLRDVNAMQAGIVSATQGIWEPDTMVLYTDAWTVLNTTQRSVTFTDDTLLQYILKSSPWLKNIEFWPRLNTSSSSSVAGAGSLGRIWMYKKDPRALAMNISQEFEQFAPQIINLSFRIPCHMRWGGLSVRYPLSMVLCDGTNG